MKIPAFKVIFTYSFHRWKCLFFIVCASSSNPLIDRSKSHGRFWAAIRLSSPRIVKPRRGRCPMDWTVKNNMVNGLFFCATSHKLQKGPYSICAGRIGNVRDGCGSGQPDLRCSWQGHSERMGADIEMLAIRERGNSKLPAEHCKANPWHAKATIRGQIRSLRTICHVRVASEASSFALHVHVHDETFCLVTLK